MTPARSISGRTTAWAQLPLLALLSLVVACGDCTDEFEAAGAFLKDPQHRSCAVEADCVVVQTGCHTFEGGLCGQSQLNRAAADSAQWEGLQNALSDCQDDTCAQCAAQLVPGCNNGLCGGR